jgi:hypothetical protein
MTMMRMKYIGGRRDEKLTVTSAYLLYELDKLPLTKELRDVTD